MAAFMAVGACACLFAPEPPARGVLHVHASMREAIVDPLREIFSRFGPSVLVFLALIAIYRLRIISPAGMANVLYTTVGFTKAEIATVSKLYGFWIGLGGVFVGGVSVARLGLMPSLVMGELVASLSHLSFALLSVSGHRARYFHPGDQRPEFRHLFRQHRLDRLHVDYRVAGLCGNPICAFDLALCADRQIRRGRLRLPGRKFQVPTFFISVASLSLPITALCLAAWRVQAQNDKKVAGAPQNSLA